MKIIPVGAICVVSLLMLVSFSDAAKKQAVSDKKSEIKVTFIELGSVNCIPCKMMQPVMKEIEEEYGDQVKVVFYDVWTKEGKPYGDKYKIRAIPTQVFLDKDGKEFFRHLGFYPKDDIVKVIEKQGVTKTKTAPAKTSAKQTPIGGTCGIGEVCK